MENNENNKLCESGNLKLPPLSIKKELHEKFKKAIEKFNKLNLIDKSMVEFRRIAIVYLTEHILADDFSLLYTMDKPKE